MARDPYFPHGRPSRTDVDQAARLLITYQDADALSPEFGQMFARTVDDLSAVLSRVKEIRALQKDPQ